MIKDLFFFIIKYLNHLLYIYIRVAKIKSATMHRSMYNNILINVIIYVKQIESTKRVYEARSKMSRFVVLRSEQKEEVSKENNRFLKTLKNSFDFVLYKKKIVCKKYLVVFYNYLHTLYSILFFQFGAHCSIPCL